MIHCQICNNLRRINKKNLVNLINHKTIIEKHTHTHTHILREFCHSIFEFKKHI